MYETICFKEDRYFVKNLSGSTELFLAGRLRHQVFAETLKWIPPKDNALDFDEYDKYAVHFGVFNNSELTSYMRLIMPEDEFMIEKIEAFKRLLPPGFSLIKDSAAEISRFCTRTDCRNTRAKANDRYFFQSLCLSKGVYHWCRLNNIRYLYAITEYKIFRLFKNYGFPFKTIGTDFHIMPDGTRVVVMILDWKEFEYLSQMQNREAHEWITECPQYSPARLQLQQRSVEAGLLHPA
ncbi:MAG: GNAT family N-acetyltransferase [Nitrospiraceae bacterium]|nr:GNAT family N-acetyltransferase [Nitrospiraceae bacterium]